MKVFLKITIKLIQKQTTFQIVHQHHQFIPLVIESHPLKVSRSIAQQSTRWASGFDSHPIPEIRGFFSRSHPPYTHLVGRVITVEETPEKKKT